MIDAGTGSETGKLFAVVRALTASEIEVTGLISSQWNTHPDAPDNPVQTSQLLNEKILELMNRTDIPSPKGSDTPFGFQGANYHLTNEASSFYIKEAEKIKKGEKINILVLGSLTNIAYAVSQDPRIASYISLYFTGFKYNPKTSTWNKNDTNVRYDLDAVDLLLNTPDLEMHILPSDITNDFIFSQDEILSLMEGKGEPWNFLISQWKRPLHLHTRLPMPEVAVVEALINPKYTKSTEVDTPPENFRRKVHVISYVNKHMMRSAYLNTLKKQRKEVISPP